MLMGRTIPWHCCSSSPHLPGATWRSAHLPSIGVDTTGPKFDDAAGRSPGRFFKTFADLATRVSTCTLGPCGGGFLYGLGSGAKTMNSKASLFLGCGWSDFQLDICRGFRLPQTRHGRLRHCEFGASPGRPSLRPHSAWEGPPKAKERRGQVEPSGIEQRPKLTLESSTTTLGGGEKARPTAPARGCRLRALLPSPVCVEGVGRG